MRGVDLLGNLRGIRTVSRGVVGPVGWITIAWRSTIAGRCAISRRRSTIGRVLAIVAAVSRSIVRILGSMWHRRVVTSACIGSSTVCIASIRY